MRYSGTPTMLEGYPLTTSEMIKMDGLLGKNTIDISAYEEAYESVVKYEREYGRSEIFSTEKRAEFLLWFNSLDSDKWTEWTG